MALERASSAVLWRVPPTTEIRQAGDVPMSCDSLLASIAENHLRTIFMQQQSFLDLGKASVRCCHSSAVTKRQLRVSWSYIGYVSVHVPGIVPVKTTVRRRTRPIVSWMRTCCKVCSSESLASPSTAVWGEVGNINRSMLYAEVWQIDWKNMTIIFKR